VRAIAGPRLIRPRLLDPADERIEREREEERDHDPREHVACDPDDLERDRNRDRDHQEAEDRAGPQIDNALRRHGWQHREGVGRC